MTSSPLFTGSFDWLHAALALTVITDLCLLGAERRRLCIRLLALQGFVMGMLPILTHSTWGDPYLWFVSALFIATKGFLLPWLLRRTHGHLAAHVPKEPYVGYSACVFLGMLGFILSLVLGGRLGITANPLFSMLFPVGLATMICGLLLIVTRRQALGQVFGYLVLENGIFVLGTPMAEEGVFWLELFILMDLLVGVFVMVAAIRHISRTFDSTDVDRITFLRD